MGTARSARPATRAARAPGSVPTIATAKFFATPTAFERWLARHHPTGRPAWIGFHRRGSGRPSITWPESVDVALCFGWIDGVRKSLDATRYAIRFSPRAPRSTWSAVNVRRVKALVAAGRMRPAGREAFDRRSAARSGIYSYEQRPERLPRDLERAFRANAAAWDYFAARPPWYRRATIWWVISAKREETRMRRFASLVAHSARSRPLPQLDRTQSESSRPRK